MGDFNYRSKYILGKLRRLYFMALPETKEDYKKSRVCFTISDVAAQSIVQLSGGTFIVTLMSFIGISDSNIGMITSLVAFAALFQLLSIQFTRKLKKVKLYVCITALQRVFLGFIFFIPLIDISKNQKIMLLIICYLIAQISVQIGAPAIQDWIASLVPGRLRGKYFAIKESVIVFALSIVMLSAGMILDYYKTKNIVTGFIIIGIAIFIFVVINVTFLSKMKEPKLSATNLEGKEMHGRILKKNRQINQQEENEGLIKGFKAAFSNLKFIKVFILTCLWNGTFYMVSPFTASYQIKELKLSYTYLMLVSFVFNLYRIMIMRKWGKLGDRYGMAKVLKFAYLFMGGNYLIMTFTVPSNAYIMLIFTSVFSSTAWGFLNIGLFGVQLDYIKSNKRMMQLSLMSSIAGIFGFFMSIVGGKILQYFQKNQMILFDKTIYAQQILNFIGFCMLLVTFLYVKIFIQNEKVEVNKSDGGLSH